MARPVMIQHRGRLSRKKRSQHLLRRPLARRHDYVHVRGPAVDGMQLPAAKPAMLAHGRFDDATAMPAEFHTGVTQGTGRMQGEAVARVPHHAAGITPAAIVAGEPRAVRRPCEEERHRTRAVGQAGLASHGGQDMYR